MSKKDFKTLLTQEVARIDAAKTAKRNERVIDTFDDEHKAVIEGVGRVLFNSNDYLGLRFHPAVRDGEEKASRVYGTGPGAVRFISGTARIYKELETAIAGFHGREDAMLFSSAFATNMGVIHCMLKGQSRDSLVGSDVLVVSDALNHRSIIDSIRIAGLEKNQKAIFEHLNLHDLEKILEENKSAFKRVIVITDGIFSMLGEYQDLKELQHIAGRYDAEYDEGVMTIVDDAHGVSCFGSTGRGTEELTGGKADLLIGTFGKGFGADGGYVVGDQAYIDYLRESAATYVYSNPFSPGTAGAACESVRIVSGDEGKKLLDTLAGHIVLFKEKMKEKGFVFAAESVHPIQPILIGDAEKTRSLTNALFAAGYLVTGISYPVVPQGKDEIRVQLSALHTTEDIQKFVSAFSTSAEELGII